MRISRLLTLSLTIVLFTLGGLISPENTTLAHHCKGGHKTLDCPKGGGTGDQTSYTVNMKVTSLLTPDAAMCTGTAGKGLDPGFLPNSCEVELFDTFYKTQNYCLFGTNVKNTNKGTKVMLFMTRDCDFGNSTGDGGYHTLELAADLVLDPGEGAPDFHIVVNEPLDGAVLTKINQPNKNVALTDKIFIDDIVYTLDP